MGIVLGVFHGLSHGVPWNVPLDFPWEIDINPVGYIHVYTLWDFTYPVGHAMGLAMINQDDPVGYTPHKTSHGKSRYIPGATYPMG